MFVKLIKKNPSHSHLQEEGLNLRDFACGDTLEGGILPGVHLHLTQPREMSHLVCERRTHTHKVMKVAHLELYVTV